MSITFTDYGTDYTNSDIKMYSLFKIVKKFQCKNDTNQVWNLYLFQTDNITPAGIRSKNIVLTTLGDDVINSSLTNVNSKKTSSNFYDIGVFRSSNNTSYNADITISRVKIPI